MTTNWKTESTPFIKLRDSSGTNINPSSEESILLLRRLVKLLESNAVVDYANRQKIKLDALGGVELTTTIPVSGTVTSTITNIPALGGNDARYQFIDAARLTYAVGIRNNLSFT